MDPFVFDNRSVTEAVFYWENAVGMRNARIEREKEEIKKQQQKNVI